METKLNPVLLRNSTVYSPSVNTVKRAQKKRRMKMINGIKEYLGQNKNNKNRPYPFGKKIKTVYYFFFNLKFLFLPRLVLNS